MKQLILIRHAKSDWGNPGLDDFDRPLNERGKNDIFVDGLEVLILQKIDRRALRAGSFLKFGRARYPNPRYWKN